MHAPSVRERGRAAARQHGRGGRLAPGKAPATLPAPSRSAAPLPRAGRGASPFCVPGSVAPELRERGSGAWASARSGSTSARRTAPSAGWAATATRCSRASRCPVRTRRRPRSAPLLYVDRGEDDDGPLRIAAGPEAIARYLESEERGGRLIQSIKSFLASRLFTVDRSILGASYRLEELASRIALARSREAAEQSSGRPCGRAVVGRPCGSSDAESDDDEALALARLAAALRERGLRRGRVRVRARRRRLALRARARARRAPPDRRLRRRHERLLAAARRAGPCAGRRRRRDSSATTAWRSPATPSTASSCATSSRRSSAAAPSSAPSSARCCPVPELDLRPPRALAPPLVPEARRSTLQLLLDLRREALEPEKLAGLLHLVEHDLGYLLLRAVERTKRELSEREHARFRFDARPRDRPPVIAAPSSRPGSRDELAADRRLRRRPLAARGCRAAAVDRVFLTGGSSLVPAVRRLFVERFGEEKLRERRRAHVGR